MGNRFSCDDIILGSVSKNRKKILQEMLPNQGFLVISADIDERSIRARSASILVSRLAFAKAESIIQRLQNAEPSLFEGNSLLITADQVVECDGTYFEKPRDIDEARYFLRCYRHEPAIPISGVLVTNLKTGKQAEGVGIARVHFRNLTDNLIENIVNSGASYHHAGGFPLDWMISNDLAEIEGPIDSVLGLPKTLTYILMAKALEP